MARLCIQMCQLLTDDVVKRLYRRNIRTVIDFLQEDPEKVVQISNLAYKDVLQIRNTLVAHYSAFPRTGVDLYNDHIQNSALIHTGVQSLDHLLDGGILTGTIFEVCGLSGSGKTQLCLTVASNVAHTYKQKVHYIDTKRDFSGRRVQTILKTQGCKEEEIAATLERILVTRISDMYELQTFLHHLKGALHHEEDGVRLIIMDSLPAVVFQFLGGSCNEGIPLLNHLANLMKYIGMEYHIAFIVVNLVTRLFDEDNTGFDEKHEDASLQDPSNCNKSETVKPALGKFWLHVPDTRVHIHKLGSEDRMISVLKSSSLPSGISCQVRIGDAGVS